MMMKDQFANYVVQKILETCNEQQREALVSRMRCHVQALRKYTYGKHIASRIEHFSGDGASSHQLLSIILDLLCKILSGTAPESTCHGHNLALFLATVAVSQRNPFVIPDIFRCRALGRKPQVKVSKFFTERVTAALGRPCRWRRPKMWSLCRSYR